MTVTGFSFKIKQIINNIKSDNTEVVQLSNDIAKTS